MNRGYSFYYSKARQLASYVLKKQKGTKFALMLYSFLSLIGKLFIFTAPIFAISDNNIACMIAKGHSFSLDKAFDGITGKKYGQLLVSYLFKILPIYILAAFIASPAIVMSIASVSNYEVAIVRAVVIENTGFTVYPEHLVFLLDLIVTLIITAIYSISRSLTYFGCDYLSFKNEELNAGDYLILSRRFSKNNKATIFWLDFTFWIHFSFFLFIPFYFAITFLSNMSGSYVVFIIAIVLLALFFIFSMALFPKDYLTKMISEYLISNDIYVAKRAIVVTKVPGEKDKYYSVLPSDDKERIMLDLSIKEDDKTKEDK